MGGIELCVFHDSTVIITKDVIPLPNCLLQWGYKCRIVSQNHISTLTVFQNTFAQILGFVWFAS